MATTARRLIRRRYRLGELVGEGAMATVSRATDERLDRQVAVKLLKPAYSADDAFVERFYAEARAAAKVVDPHVVAVYDIFSEGDAHAIVMEYLDGGSLAELLAAGRTIDEARAIDYARQAARALASAHAHGLLHRDVKPGNLLLGTDGTLKVTDFGIAKAFAATDLTLTQPGQMVGSVSYLSPEQAQGQRLTPAADLYSLGVVIYQMLTGRVPYAGTSPVSVALAIVSEPPPSLQALEAAMSPGLARIVQRLLLKDPQARYASADELDAALAALQSPQERANARVFDAPTLVAPVRAAPAPRPAAPPRMPIAIDPHRWLPVAAALLVMAALASLAAAFSPRPAALVTVGEYRHRPLRAAQAAINARGLSTRLTRAPDRRIAEGDVVAQSPAPGTHLAKGESVALTVSSGLPLVAIPDLKGWKAGPAIRAMARTTLRATYAGRISSTPAGTVVGEYPRAGSHVRERTPVTVFISAGPHPANE